MYPSQASRWYKRSRSTLGGYESKGRSQDHAVSIPTVCRCNTKSVPITRTHTCLFELRVSLEMIGDVQRVEDAQKEVAVMQYMRTYGEHPNVLGVLDVIQDDENLFMFTPFRSSGDSLSFLMGAGRFDEVAARYWFHQLLEVCVYKQWASMNCFLQSQSLSITPLWYLLFSLPEYITLARNGRVSSRSFIGQYFGE